MNLDSSSHPIALVERLRRAHSSGLMLQFSRYKYEPQSPFDYREIIEVHSDEVTESWLWKQFECLPESWDLAWHSLVTTHRKRSFHVPMVDFVATSFNKEKKRLIHHLIGNFISDSIVYYSTGRSYHGYSTALLGPQEWREFMGRLLLLNLPCSEAIVDCRWIGHRLIAGYSSLRWSSNSSHYLQMPRETVFTECGEPSYSSTSF